MSEQTGKVWFVTGSSRGLGRAFVEAALSRGDRVAATARKSLTELTAKYGDAALPLALDVTDKENVSMPSNRRTPTSAASTSS